MIAHSAALALTCLRLYFTRYDTAPGELALPRVAPTTGPPPLPPRGDVKFADAGENSAPWGNGYACGLHTLARPSQPEGLRFGCVTSYYCMLGSLAPRAHVARDDCLAPGRPWLRAEAACGQLSAHVIPRVANPAGQRRRRGRVRRRQVHLPLLVPHAAREVTVGG